MKELLYRLALYLPWTTEAYLALALAVVTMAVAAFKQKFHSARLEAEAAQWKARALAAEERLRK